MTEDQQAALTDETASAPIQAAHSPAEQETTAPGTEHTNTDMLEQTFQGMQQLLTAMQGLKQDFETKVKYDESKERMIDTLHSELQSYREGLHFKILRPLLIDLISLYDDINHIIENTQKTFPDLDTTIIGNMKSFHESVEEMLSNNGVEAFQVPEATFTPNKQRALRAVPTSDASLDKQIASRLRKGFSYENRILRPEIVETYRYVADQPQQ
ncbi:nucleotide exchange factor GrpE [Dictyobacter formicarum]|uniref:Nucleotide exchange factor GrpE n=1 Tax=Dictyobacter formicarum TaxID=2778368 RepID=A0ABQ3VKI5_9CHLR|nr:nucleotide exchange factor GrpE [Dictyobacter formicarum]GHO86338.1 hypothetical protein KSZ_43440 [Dictyobacter formicarum]